MGEPIGLSAWRNELTTVWWSYAEDEDEIEGAPAFLHPLLRGEVKRLRCSAEDIKRALAWASELPGWEPAPPDGKPLHVRS